MGTHWYVTICCLLMWSGPFPTAHSEQNVCTLAKLSPFYLHLLSSTTHTQMQWYEVLQNVAFENEFPEEKEALINSSMQFISSYSYRHWHCHIHRCHCSNWFLQQCHSGHITPPMFQSLIPHVQKFALVNWHLMKGDRKAKGGDGVPAPTPWKKPWSTPP